MADDSGGSGFMGLMAGLVIAALLIVGGLFLFNGGFGRGDSAEINVQVPEAPSPPG